MDGAKRDISEPVELVRSDLRGLWVLSIPAVFLIAAALVLSPGPKTTLVFGGGFAGVSLVPIFIVRWAVGRNAIFADPLGLIAVDRGRGRRAAEWDEIRDASWYEGTLWLGWDPSGIMLTTDQGQSRVGSIVIARRKRRAEAADHVLTYLAARLPRQPATK